MKLKCIGIIGIGYVGLAYGLTLSKHYSVTMFDLDPSKIRKINRRQSPISNNEFKELISNHFLDIQATDSKINFYANNDVFIIAIPTDFSDQEVSLETNSISIIINEIRSINKNALIVIKSTVPISYTASQLRMHNTDRIIFSPEFLREDTPITDLQRPSRLVVGGDKVVCNEFLNILLSVIDHEDVNIVCVPPDEAEAIKIFSNAYLALRVAFFNELDSFCIENSLDCSKILSGVCSDQRIGNVYNNPSFGFGGYCLPKDTRQLSTQFSFLASNLFSATLQANQIRKTYISDYIKNLGIKKVGIYRLLMKSGATNFRNSAVFDIIHELEAAGINIEVFEPDLCGSHNFNLVSDIDKFKSTNELIVANRIDASLIDVKEKLFTRDIYGYS